MTTLYIPDVHLRLDPLKRILADYEDCVDHVVFLGDYADNWKENSKSHRTSNTKATFTWLKDNLDNPKYTFLVGNHDYAYACSYFWAQCSGWTYDKQKIIDGILTPDDWRKFKFFDLRNNVLASHAGIDASLMLPVGIPENMNEALWEMTATGLQHPWLMSGIDRGGYAPVGGLMWIDWNNFTPFDGPFIHIVGHTEVKTPDVHNYTNGVQAINLDTGLRDIAIAQNGTLKVLSV